MLKAQAIKKSYGSLQILKGVDLEVAHGEIVTIVGASGAGKSSLLNIIGTLDKPDSGTVWINGQEVRQLSSTKLSAFRNKQIGFIFQFHHLLTEFSALENVCIPAFIAGQSKSEAEKRAKELLNLLGLADRLQHKPSELSGGEQQRVAVARALVSRPEIVFADEPTGNLDSRSGGEVLSFLRQAVDAFGQTIVMVTHDPVAAAYADSVLFLSDGRLVDSLEQPSARRVLDRLEAFGA